MREIRKEHNGKQHQRLFVKLASHNVREPVGRLSDTQANISSPEEIATMPSPFRSVDDPDGLRYTRDLYEYLDSARLHYCWNCDEEWLVFDENWPQHGVAFAGPMAGKCETILRAGFQVSWKDNRLCNRCAGQKAYATMFSADNQQHLGCRRAPLSALTWYESLLLARVHPVVSVMTLTATGLLCYAGHVTNYFVNTMEWFKGLPAKIQDDKRWFLIKRRCSVGPQAASSTVRKKPTTANYARLTAAFRDVLSHMPNVYKGSKWDFKELAKFPPGAEVEMLEQAESVDLDSDVKIDRESFSLWVKELSPERYTCADAIMTYAIDIQGREMHVDPDTAWELCCRSLHRVETIPFFTSRDLANLLVYLLDESKLSSTFQEAIYAGMTADLESRGKTIVTEQDEEAMKCRWVRLQIQAELDKVRAMLSVRDGTEISIELEVNDTIAEAEAPSLEAEAEQKARAVIESAQASVGSYKWPNGRDQGVWNDSTERDGSQWLGTDESFSAPAPVILPQGEGNATSNASHTIGSGDGHGDDGVESDAMWNRWWDDGDGSDDEEDLRIYNSQASAANVCSSTEPVSATRASSQNIPCATGSTQTRHAVASKSSELQDKPLVDPPQVETRVKDTEKEPFWIPGAFPTIFQNETGDPYNYVLKEVDLHLWGPHILRSRGWHAQSHMTFMYWWSNMMQRVQALSAKKWFVRDNPQASGYTAEDLANMSIGMLSKKMVFLVTLYARFWRI